MSRARFCPRFLSPYINRCLPALRPLFLGPHLSYRRSLSHRDATLPMRSHLRLIT